MSEADEGNLHTISQGESTTRLAFEHGLFWKSVWDHGKNGELRRLRKDPNVLLTGDEIFLPALRRKEETCAHEKRHKFKRKGVPEKLNVRFLDLDGKPYANEPYKLIIDDRLKEGSLDGDGWLRAAIPPNARTAHVTVGKFGECASVEMNLGHLDPVSELTGVQARLRNLGCYQGPITGESSPEFELALANFREANGLDAKAGVDDEFRDKLKQVHGI